MGGEVGVSNTTSIQNPPNHAMPRTKGLRGKRIEVMAVVGSGGRKEYL